MDRRWQGRHGRVTVRAVLGASVLTAAAGLFVLVVGWFLGVESVTTVVPGLSSMKANTALGFVLAGSGLALVARLDAPRTGQVLASASAVLGAATALQYVAGIDLGIDELLVADTFTSDGTVAGRMGLNSALAFAGIGTAIAALGGRRGRLRSVAQGLSIAVLVLAGIALLAYVLGVTARGGLASATEMALHTAVLFVLLAMAATAATADVGLLRVLTRDEPAGRTARLLVPVIVAAQIAVLVALEVASTAGVLTDARLQLALGAVGAVLVSLVAVLAVLTRTARTERRATRVTRDRNALRAAFSDLHLRIAPDGTILSVHAGVGDHGVDLDQGMPGDVGRLPAPAGGAVRDAVVAARRQGRASSTFEHEAGTFEVRAAALSDGEVAVAVGDVTELAHAQMRLRELATSLEEQVAARTAELARSNQELERFAYLASHDLQEPLRMVTSFVSRLQDRYGDVLDERGREYVHYAVDGARRMQHLIEGLLAYSRAGRLDPERVGVVDLADVVDDVLATMEEHVGASGAHMAFDLAPARTHGDPVLLRQVVQNLVGNALKFTRADVEPEVTVATETIDGAVVLRVEDNGTGIDPANRAAVFEMFRRFDSRVEARGTGIGLSLVQQIVAAHDGTVDVTDATAGPGTRFTVRLPATGDSDG